MRDEAVDGRPEGDLLVVHRHHDVQGDGLLREVVADRERDELGAHSAVPSVLAVVEDAGWVRS